jgi:hypothetical protein
MYGSRLAYSVWSANMRMSTSVNKLACHNKLSSVLWLEYIAQERLTALRNKPRDATLLPSASPNCADIIFVPKSPLDLPSLVFGARRSG